MSEHRLADVPLFRNLSEAAIAELAAASRVRRYPAGQVIWSEGDPGDALLVLEEGRLRISKVSRTGQESVLSIVEPPAAVGELALLDGAPRDAAVFAQRAVVIRLVPRSAFLALLRREPAVVEGLLATLTAMIRASNQRHARLLGLDVPGRLAVWLLDRSERVGVAARDGSLSFDLDRSQGELAAELGTTRSTLNRAIQELAALGLIAVDGERVSILDGERLRVLGE
jgi:CRP-like cAMP-binding protein